MPVTYDDDYKAAVVAYAEMAGPVAAAKEFELDVRVVKGWVAGAKPSSALARARDVALATVTRRLAKGQMRDRDAAVTYGILADKAARYDKPADISHKTPEDEWADQLEKDIRALDPEERHDLALYLQILLRAGEDAFGDPIAFLHSIEDPIAWLDAKRAETTAAYQAQIERNRLNALRWEMHLPALSDEDLALVARAQAEVAAT